MESRRTQDGTVGTHVHEDTQPRPCFVFNDYKRSEDIIINYQVTRNQTQKLRDKECKGTRDKPVLHH